MKTKQNLAIVCIIATMMMSFLSKAQVTNKPWGEVEKAKQGWQSVNLDGKGNHVQGGVEFYNQKSTCNSKEVTILKLVNLNNHSVKVSYQQSAESPVVNILVPASATIEGVCGVADGNLAKLVITPLTPKTDEEKQKNKDFMRAHITVSPIK
jgi:hypothetical protein